MKFIQLGRTILNMENVEEVSFDHYKKSIELHMASGHGYIFTGKDYVTFCKFWQTLNVMRPTSKKGSLDSPDYFTKRLFEEQLKSLVDEYKETLCDNCPLEWLITDYSMAEVVLLDFGKWLQEGKPKEDRSLTL